MRTELILLSTPYTANGENAEQIKRERYEAACKMVVKLMQQGFYVFSPIAYGISLINLTNENLPDTYEFWEEFVIASVTSCSKIFVLEMPGWEESNGVNAEIIEARRQGKSVFLVEFDLNLDTPVVIKKQIL